MGDCFEEDQREVVRSMVWFGRSSGACFYRLIVGRKVPGRSSARTWFPEDQVMGEGLGMLSRSWRSSSGSWRSRRGSGAGGDARCPAEQWRTSPSSTTGTVLGRGNGGVRELEGSVLSAVERGEDRAWSR